MTGHAIQSIDAAMQGMRTGTDVRTRRNSLREIMLARALYRCGDKAGLGARILSEYVKDLRGHLSRHAKAVLDAGPGPAPVPPRRKETGP